MAWHPLGWRAAFLSEIKPFPRAVLAHHYPNVPLHGDFTTIQAGDYEPIDLLVGGTPCQSFSVAGLRGGLADERGNLALEFLRLAERLRPRWLVWENVPGVLSSGGGRDFGSFLGGLVQLGYGFSYRVLDAQFYGLAQRRKRVFVVGYLGDWRRAWAVLSQPASLRWDSPPRRETREGTTDTLSSRATAGGGLGTDFECSDGVVAATLEATMGRSRGAGTLPGALTPTFLHCNKGRPDGRKSAHTEMVTLEDIVPTLATDGHAQSAVAIPLQEISKRTGVSTDDPRAGIGIGQDGDPMFTLQAGAQQHGIAVAYRLHAYGSTAMTGDGCAAAAAEVAIARALDTCGGFTAGQGGNLIAQHDVLAFDARQSDVIQYGDQSGPLDTDGHTVGVLQSIETLQPRTDIATYASAQEGHAASLLLPLRQAIGAEAFAEWGLGVSDSLRAAKILRPEVHGAGVRRQADEAGRRMDDRALSCTQSGACGIMSDLRQAGRERRAPQGRGLPEQFAGELSQALSKLSHEGPQSEAFLLCLRRACEGVGILQPPLSPPQGRAAVRRLTPTECEKLQGFPPGYTRIPYGKKGKGSGWSADGPRYRALGNSFAVPVVRWIGERIEAQEQQIKLEAARQEAEIQAQRQAAA